MTRTTADLAAKSEVTLSRSVRIMARLRRYERHDCGRTVRTKWHDGHGEFDWDTVGDVKRKQSIREPIVVERLSDEVMT